MAVRIRLKRIGRKNRPYFRVAVFEGSTRRDGRTLEIVGHYDPIQKDDKGRVVMNRERIEHWIKNGAKPSAQVANLLKIISKEPAPQA